MATVMTFPQGISASEGVSITSSSSSSAAARNHPALDLDTLLARISIGRASEDSNLALFPSTISTFEAELQKLRRKKYFRSWYNLLKAVSQEKRSISRRYFNKMISYSKIFHKDSAYDRETESIDNAPPADRAVPNRAMPFKTQPISNPSSRRATMPAQYPQRPARRSSVSAMTAKYPTPNDMKIELQAARRASMGMPVKQSTVPERSKRASIVAQTVKHVNSAITPTSNVPTNIARPTPSLSRLEDTISTSKDSPPRLSLTDIHEDLSFFSSPPWTASSSSSMAASTIKSQPEIANIFSRNIYRHLENRLNAPNTTAGHTPTQRYRPRSRSLFNSVGGLFPGHSDQGDMHQWKAGSSPQQQQQHHHTAGDLFGTPEIGLPATLSPASSHRRLSPPPPPPPPSHLYPPPNGNAQHPALQSSILSSSSSGNLLSQASHPPRKELVTPSSLVVVDVHVLNLRRGFRCWNHLLHSSILRSEQYRRSAMHHKVSLLRHALRKLKTWSEHGLGTKISVEESISYSPHRLVQSLLHELNSKTMAYGEALPSMGWEVAALRRCWKRWMQRGEVCFMEAEMLVKASCYYEQALIRKGLERWWRMWRDGWAGRRGAILLQPQQDASIEEEESDQFDEDPQEEEKEAVHDIVGHHGMLAASDEQSEARRDEEGHQDDSGALDEWHDMEGGSPFDGEVLEQLRDSALQDRCVDQDQAEEISSIGVGAAAWRNSALDQPTDCSQNDDMQSQLQWMELEADGDYECGEWVRQQAEEQKEEEGQEEEEEEEKEGEQGDEGGEESGEEATEPSNDRAKWDEDDDDWEKGLVSKTAPAVDSHEEQPMPALSKQHDGLKAMAAVLANQAVANIRHRRHAPPPPPMPLLESRSDELISPPASSRFVGAVKKWEEDVPEEVFAEYDTASPHIPSSLADEEDGSAYRSATSPLTVEFPLEEEDPFFLSPAEEEIVAQYDSHTSIQAESTLPALSPKAVIGGASSGLHSLVDYEARGSAQRNSFLLPALCSGGAEDEEEGEVLSVIDGRHIPISPGSPLARSTIPVGLNGLSKGWGTVEVTVAVANPAHQFSPRSPSPPRRRLSSEGNWGEFEGVSDEMSFCVSSASSSPIYLDLSSRSVPSLAHYLYRYYLLRQFLSHWRAVHHYEKRQLLRGGLQRWKTWWWRGRIDHEMLCIAASHAVSRKLMGGWRRWRGRKGLPPVPALPYPSRRGRRSRASVDRDRDEGKGGSLSKQTHLGFN